MPPTSEQQEREAFEAWCNRTFVVNKLSRWRDGYEDAKFAYAWEAWQARAALAANVPAGWKLVPVEPTQKMIDAGRMATDDKLYPQDFVNGPRMQMRDRWEAMLAATPPAPAPEATPAQAQQADCDGGTCGLGGYCDNCPATKAATPAPAEPVAWGMRDKTTGLILDVICPDEHESFEGDYTVPLFAAPVAQAEPRKPLTESALCKEVCEYGPQSEDEETGFRDGFRAAERVHGIKEQP